jgi:hypothetical protein
MDASEKGQGGSSLRPSSSKTAYDAGTPACRIPLQKGARCSCQSSHHAMHISKYVCTVRN